MLGGLRGGVAAVDGPGRAGREAGDGAASVWMDPHLAGEDAVARVGNGRGGQDGERRGRAQSYLCCGHGGECEAQGEKGCELHSGWLGKGVVDGVMVLGFGI